MFACVQDRVSPVLCDATADYPCAALPWLQSRGLKVAGDDHMERVRDLHKNIMSRVEQVQQQTGRILQGKLT